MTTILTTTGRSLYDKVRRIQKVDVPTIDQMRQYLYREPKDASSEANSLLRMAQTDDHIVLLHTKDQEVELCVNLLKDFFASEGYKHVHSVRLDFQSNEQYIETVGIRNLVNVLIDEIEKAQKDGQEVIINATAGLKAQVVYSTMIGMLYNVPVKYLYEDFRRVVTFSPIALDWDTSLFLFYEPFFIWLEEDLRTSQQVERYLERIPEQERIRELLAAPDADGAILLSYMGDALQRRFKRETEEAQLVQWPPSANTANIEDKIASSLLNRKHHIIKDGSSIYHKIAQLDCVEQVIGGHFEPTTRGRIRQVYADGSILLLWADNTKAERLTIHTTAKGKSQTLKVAREIQNILKRENNAYLEFQPPTD